MVGYIGGVTTPVIYLLYAATYSGKSLINQLKYRWVLFIIPGVAIILAATNHLHGLIWSGFTPGPPGSNSLIYERILKLTDRVAERFNVRTRPINMNDFANELKKFIELSNKSLANNWGYAPVTNAEAETMAKDLKPVLHEKAIIFAEDCENRLIGFGIALPDVNQILKSMNGRLFPFGWLKLLLRLPRLTHYRMFALGVLPEYHGKAIDSLIYRALYESCFSPNVRMEINYVLENNGPMNNAILKLGAKPLRRYRIFQKTIA